MHCSSDRNEERRPPRLAADQNRKLPIAVERQQPTGTGQLMLQQRVGNHRYAQNHSINLSTRFSERKHRNNSSSIPSLSRERIIRMYTAVAAKGLSGSLSLFLAILALAFAFSITRQTQVCGGHSSLLFWCQGVFYFETDDWSFLHENSMGTYTPVLIKTYMLDRNNSIHSRFRRKNIISGRYDR